jgi:hypothetical protein
VEEVALVIATAAIVAENVPRARLAASEIIVDDGVLDPLLKGVKLRRTLERFIIRDPSLGGGRRYLEGLSFEIVQLGVCQRDLAELAAVPGEFIRAAERGGGTAAAVVRVEAPIGVCGVCDATEAARERVPQRPGPGLHRLQAGGNVRFGRGYGTRQLARRQA